MTKQELKSYTEKLYRDCLLLVKIGRYSTLRYAVNSLKKDTAGFRRTYNKAVEKTLAEDYCNKIQQWEKLPANNYRQEFVRLFLTNQDLYLDKEYLKIGYVNSAYSPRYQVTKIYREIEQLVEERFND